MRLIITSIIKSIFQVGYLVLRSDDTGVRPRRGAAGMRFIIRVIMEKVHYVVPILSMSRTLIIDGIMNRIVL